MIVMPSQVVDQAELGEQDEQRDHRGDDGQGLHHEQHQ